MDKMRAYNLQDLGHDTVQANLMLSHPPDKRSYQVASLFLRDLNVTKLRLLTNNPDKIRGLERDGDVEIVERLSMIPRHWQAIIQQHRSRGDGVDQVQEEDGGEEVLLLDQQQQHQHHQDQLRRSCLSPLVPASVTSTNTAPIPLPSLSSPYATVIKDEPLSTLEGENASISQTILTTTSSIINHSSIIVPSSLDHQQPNSLDHSSTMTANVSLSKQQSSRHSASTGTNNNNSSSRSSNYRRSSSHSRSPTRTGLQRLPPVVALTKVDEYIITKVERMQHMLDIPKELLDIIHKI